MNEVNVNTTEKPIPVIGNVDILVIGGGIAGISAAVSAARNGKSVILS